MTKFWTELSLGFQVGSLELILLLAHRLLSSQSFRVSLNIQCNQPILPKVTINDVEHIQIKTSFGGDMNSRKIYIVSQKVVCHPKSQEELSLLSLYKTKTTFFTKLAQSLELDLVSTQDRAQLVQLTMSSSKKPLKKMKGRCQRIKKRIIVKNKKNC